MSIVVFIGPSCCAEARPKSCLLTYRPSARRGDFISALQDKPTALVLIDGAMIYEYPPSPQEVAFALECGTPVYGAASIGALRAAELTPLGMRGVGWIFRQFENGTIDCDDELLCSFDEETQERLSIPLINVRYACDRLVASGEIKNATAQAFIRDIASEYYEHRSSNFVRMTATKHGIDLDAIRLLDPLYDIKSHDSIDCIKIALKENAG